MALVPHQNIYADRNGNVIVGATVTVTIASTGAAATLYSDSAGASPILGNVVLTNDNGVYSFYVQSGRYRIAIAKAGYDSVTREEVLFDPENQSIYVDAGDDAAERINAAITALGGPGTVQLGPGTFNLTNTNPSAVSWASRRAVWVNEDGITIRGAGVGATILRLVNDADCHVIQVGNRGDSPALAITDCLITELTIDGNRTNQTEPTELNDHWAGIEVASESERVNLKNLHIHDTQYYGFGYQRNGFTDCHVDGIVLENCGTDGLDWKDDDGSNRGNTINNVSVKNFGLVGALAIQAGIDVRGGVKVTNATVTGFASERAGIRVQSGISAVNPTGTTIDNFTIKPSSEASTLGLVLNAGTYENIASVGVGRIDGCNVGLYVAGDGNQVDNVQFSNCRYATNIVGDQTQLSNIRSTGGTLFGVLVQSSYNVLTNVVVTGNAGQGLAFGGSADNNVVVGGALISNTLNFSNSGANNSINGVAGLKTRSTGTASFAIDSVTEVTVEVPHTLGIVPSLNAVTLTLIRDTAVTDYVVGAPVAYLATSTIIYCKVRVITASATGGAVMTLRADVRAHYAAEW